MSTAPRGKDRELADLLLEAQVVTAAQLEALQKTARRSGRPLWRLVIREGFCTEEQLFRAVNERVRMPVLAEDALDNVVVPAELKTALPHAVAQHLGILPLERSTDGRRAALAMIDPTLDISAIWPPLSKLGVVEVRRFLISMATLRKGLEMFYGLPWQADDDEDDAAPRVEPKVETAPTRSAITQPIPVPAPSVMVDPMLEEEIAKLAPPSPAAPPVVAPPPSRPVESDASSATTPVRPVSAWPGASEAARAPVLPPQPSGKVELDLPDMPTPPLGSVKASFMQSGAWTPGGAPASAAPAPAPAPVAAQVPPTGRSATANPTPTPTPMPVIPSARNVVLPPAPAPVAAIPPASAPMLSGPTPLALDKDTTPILIRSVEPLEPAEPLHADLRKPRAPTRPPAPPSPGAQPTSVRSPAPLPAVVPPPIVVPPAAAAMVAPLQPIGAPAGKSKRDISLIELQADDVHLDSGPGIGTEPVIDALLATIEAVLNVCEPALRSTWPTTLMQIARGVAERLNFAPRAVREVALVARLYGVLRVDLRAGGTKPLPKASESVIGFEASHPLMKALTELQALLVDFMRSPLDPEDVPLGARVVSAAVQALELISAGHIGDPLAVRLLKQVGDSDVTQATLRAIELDLSAMGALPVPGTAWDREPEPAAAQRGERVVEKIVEKPVDRVVEKIVERVVEKIVEKPVDRVVEKIVERVVEKPVDRVVEKIVEKPVERAGRVRWPLPPRMPDVSWRAVVLKDLSDEGLEPYTPPAPGR